MNHRRTPRSVVRNGLRALGMAAGAAALVMLPSAQAHAAATASLKIIVNPAECILFSGKSKVQITYDFRTDPKFTNAPSGITVSFTLFGADPFSDDTLFTRTSPPLDRIVALASNNLGGCISNSVLNEDSGLTSGDEVYARVTLKNVATGAATTVQTNEFSFLV